MRPNDLINDDEKFDEWIRVLDEDVIQGAYGYEEGEFGVFPEQWRPLYDEGLCPLKAWQRALDAHREDHMPANQRNRDEYG